MWLHQGSINECGVCVWVCMNVQIYASMFAYVYVCILSLKLG